MRTEWQQVTHSILRFNFPSNTSYEARCTLVSSLLPNAAPKSKTLTGTQIRSPGIGPECAIKGRLTGDASGPPSEHRTGQDCRAWTLLTSRVHPRTPKSGDSIEVAKSSKNGLRSI